MGSFSNSIPLGLIDRLHPETAGFTTPFWRNTFILSLAVVAFYKYAPAPGEDVYLTRYLAHYGTPSEIWSKINEKHLLMSQKASEVTALQTDAQRPNLHRYRHPQSAPSSSHHLCPVISSHFCSRFLDTGSPHLQPVGTSVDMGSVVAKMARE